MSSIIYKNALGIDLGASKVGIARVNCLAKIPEPLAVVKNDGELVQRIKSFIGEYDIDLLVFGLPRNMNGEQTEQSKIVHAQASGIAEALSLRYIEQDETLSSVRAQEYMKKARMGEEDAIAACIILEDFTSETS